MNRKISTHWAIVVIIVLAIAVVAFSWEKLGKLNTSFTGNKSVNYDALKKLSNQKTCKNHVFEGTEEVKVDVWQVVKNDKKVLQVAKEDIAKLPDQNIEDFQLIDPTPELEKKIAASSEKKPVEVSLSGFAILCSGNRLASLDYKDGIFRPYIN